MQKVWEEPMVAWAAAVVALLLGIFTYFASDPSAVLQAAAEIGGVVALFTLICATEAWN
jgi:hypothetical protein